MPESRQRYPALDGLRGLAALAVVTTHVGFQTGRNAQPGPVGAVLSRLDYGVTVFFLLSGFLLCRPFLRPDRPDLRAYARRRLARVLPVYLVAVVAALAVFPGARDGAGSLVRQLTLTQVYGGGGEALVPGLTQMWSLGVELAFYAVLPLLGLALVRWSPARVLVGMGVLGLGWTALAAGWSAMPATANLWLPGYLDWFALGIAGAVLQDRAAPRLRSALEDLGAAVGTCWGLALLLLLLAATPLGGPRLLDAPSGWEALAKHALYGASAALLLLPVLFPGTRPHPALQVLEARPLAWLGRISFSVFCLHLVVLQLVLLATGTEPFTGRAVPVWLLTVALSLALSTLTHRLVELPPQRWAHRPRQEPVRV